MINIYDFDETIYNGDSTRDFYFFCLKKNWRIIFWCFVQLYGFILFLLNIKDKDFFKEKAFVFLKSFDDVDALVKEFWDTHSSNMKNWYLKQKKDSDIIISASPEFLLKPIAKKYNFKLIATNVNKKNGKMESTNCYGEEKVNRLKKDKSYNSIKNKINGFYSDSYSDEPIAKLAKKAYIVKKDKLKNWDFKNGKYKKNIKLFLLTFTIVFAILFYLCFEFYFGRHVKSYFRTYDGIDQHYLIFIYIGDLIRNLISGKGIIMWNNGIGYGADVITSLAAYLHDPFNYISVFFSHEKAEFGFNIMILLKFYAVGLSFGLYGFYKKYDFKKILVGAILYTFCATTYVTFIESFFINPMYIFPILIIGADKLLKGDKPIIYVLSLAYSFINYFYFAYMMCIFIVFFCLINYLFNKDVEKSFKSFFKIVFRFFVYSLLALGISMAVILPILKALLSINRLDLSYYLPILYDKDYYIGIIKGFTNFYSMSGRDAFIGFGALSLPCIIYLFFIKDKSIIKYKIEFILLFIILIVPFLSTILNGFSYYSNRWIWALAFLVCDIVCISLDHFKDINLKKAVTIFLLIILNVIIVMVFFHYSSTEFVACIISATIMFALMYLCKSKQYFKNTCIIFAIISVCLSSSFFFRGSYEDSTRDKVYRGSAYNSIYNNAVYNLLNNVESNGLRYGDFGNSAVRNASWLYGISGVDHYISIYNNDISVFNDEIGLVTGSSPMDYRGLNSKSELNHLFGVNYFISQKDIPYGYNYVKSANGYNLYEPQKQVSLIYGYKNITNKADYEILSPYDREKTLMESIVLEDEKTNYTICNQNKIMEYNVDTSYGIEVKDNRIVADYVGKIILTFEKTKDSELYLFLEDVTFENENDSVVTINIKAYSNEEEISSSYIGIANNKTHMYGNKKNYLINLGTNSIDKVELYLNKGTYSYSQISFYQRNIVDIEESINNLNNIVEKQAYENNRFIFNVNAKEDEYALITIPYSYGGWKAYLDNSEVEILKADTAFMAIKVPKGNHVIELKYRTPYLLEGLIISIISFAILAIIYFKSLREIIRKNDLIIQIIKFVFVGGTATIIDIVIYYICYNKLNINPLLANIISFTISLVFNYFASVKWVFVLDEKKSKRTMFILFIALAVMGLLISELLLFIFINKLFLNKLLSKIIATLIVMVFNFVTRKLLLEKRNKKVN